MAAQKTTGGKSPQSDSRSNSRNSAAGSDGVMAVGMMAGAIGLGITLLDKEKAEASALEAEFTTPVPAGDVAVASAP